MKKIIFLLLIASCSPKTYIGNRYLTTVTENYVTKPPLWSDSTAPVDSMSARYGIILNYDSVFRYAPYVELRTGNIILYSEKKAVYERNGKIFIRKF